MIVLRSTRSIRSDSGGSSRTRRSTRSATTPGLTRSAVGTICTATSTATVETGSEPPPSHARSARSTAGGGTTSPTNGPLTFAGSSPIWSRKPAAPIAAERGRFADAVCEHRQRTHRSEPDSSSGVRGPHCWVPSPVKHRPQRSGARRGGPSDADCADVRRRSWHGGANQWVTVDPVRVREGGHRYRWNRSELTAPCGGNQCQRQSGRSGIER